MNFFPLQHCQAASSIICWAYLASGKKRGQHQFRGLVNDVSPTCSHGICGRGRTVRLQLRGRWQRDRGCRLREVPVGAGKNLHSSTSILHWCRWRCLAVVHRQVRWRVTHGSQHVICVVAVKGRPARHIPVQKAPDTLLTSRQTGCVFKFI